MKRFIWGLIILGIVCIATLILVRQNADNRLYSPIPIEEGVHIIYVTPKQ